MPAKKHTAPTTTTGNVNTDLGYGILDGHFVNYKVVTGGEEIWAKDGVVTTDPRPVVPAGSVQHPILGTGELGAIQVWYWVDGAGRKIVYKPASAFGQIIP